MNPQVKQRIDQIRHGEVPEGYCQAKDCIYPSDWICKKMSDWLELIERPLTLEDQETYQLVTVRRSFGGVDSRGYYKGRDVLVKTYFEVKEGDFLISKRQIAHGACGIVPKSLDCAVVSNEYNLFVPKTGTNIELFNMMMQLPHYKRLFYLMSDGVHIEKLLFKTKDWMKRVIAMPPLPEQQKIAEILTTQDKLIELQARKIEQLQALKKAYLQRMFPKKGCDRPEIRFAGFTDAWEQRELGECFEERTERSAEGELIAVTINSGVVKASDLNRHDNSSEDKSNYKVVRVNDIAYNSMRMWQGASGYSQYDGILSPAYTVVIPRKNVNPVFFSYMFKKTDMIHEFQINSQGLTSDTWSLKFPAFSTISAKVPKLEEQQAIANYFKSLDHLITFHQRKLDEEKSPDAATADGDCEGKNMKKVVNVRVKKKDSNTFIQIWNWSKKNTGFATLLLTISTAVCNFLIKLILYMYYLGYYSHFGIDSKYINYENPSSIMSFAISVVICVFCYCIIGWIIDIWEKNKVKAFFVIPLVVFITLFVFSMLLIPLNWKAHLLFSLICSVLLTVGVSLAYGVVKLIIAVWKMFLRFIKWCKCKLNPKHNQDTNKSNASPRQKKNSNPKLVLIIVCCYIFCLYIRFILLERM